MDTFDMYYKRRYLIINIIASIVLIIFIISIFCIDQEKYNARAIFIWILMFWSIIDTIRTCVMKISVHGNEINYKSIFINRKYNIEDITSVTIDQMLVGKLYRIYADSKVLFKFSKSLINFDLLIQKLKMAKIEFDDISNPK